MSGTDDSAAEDKSRLAPVFNAAARQAYFDFPELAGKFLIVDLTAPNIYGVPDLEKTKFNSVEEVEEYLGDAAQSAIEGNTSTSTYGPAHDLKVIFYNNAGTQTLGGANDTAANVLGVLDHELGHLVIKDALATDSISQTIYAETAADMFAIMRKARREEKNDLEAVDILAFTRTRALLLRGNDDDVAHFTGFGLKELADIGKTTDFSKTRPQMAAGLAETLAHQYAPTEEATRAIVKAFVPYAEAARDPARKDDALKILADITLAPEASNDVRRAGSIVLDLYLQSKIQVNGARVKLEGEYWDDVRTRLKTASRPQGLLILPKSGLNPSP